MSTKREKGKRRQAMHAGGTFNHHPWINRMKATREIRGGDVWGLRFGGRANGGKMHFVFRMFKVTSHGALYNRPSQCRTNEKQTNLPCRARTFQRPAKTRRIPPVKSKIRPCQASSSTPSSTLSPSSPSSLPSIMPP